MAQFCALPLTATLQARLIDQETPRGLPKAIRTKCVNLRFSNTFASLQIACHRARGRVPEREDKSLTSLKPYVFRIPVKRSACF
jgi:hypothetical protein